MASNERAFPTLTPAQTARVATHGRQRAVRAGEVLVEQGSAAIPFFVLINGELEAVHPVATTEMPVTTIVPGQFTGEINILAGRRALFTIRATKPGEVIELDRHELLGLMQTDAQLGDIMMRAFILRRVGLVEAGIGDVVLIGSAHSAATLRIKEFLMRNGHPYAYLDLDRDPDVQKFMDGFHFDAAAIPVVICRGQVALRNPSDREIAECLGFNEAIDPKEIRDLIVIGAGPSGLAAAVYGASEGLDVLVIETTSPGGQAGSSSKIENYLGFPTGISGQDLAGRAYSQAEKFGAQIFIGSGVRLGCERTPYLVETDDGNAFRARSIVVASGVQYRKLDVADLIRFEGAGVYYAATNMEGQLCVGEDLIVIGGANSAGQAAVFLAESAGTVHILIRSDALSTTMSRYLVRRVEATPNIVLHPHTEIEALEGGDQLEAVCWRDSRTGATERHAIRHVFVMTGGLPNTSWLRGCLALDSNGFIKTGPELTPGDLGAARWPLLRAPYLLESSLPGVFAVGDVRSQSVKRVASAVGEGSIAISFVHQVLRQ